MPAELGGGLYPSIVLVVGTRPEAIKLAPVAKALSVIGLEPSILFTGQHPALDPAAHGLSRFAVTRLDCAGMTDPDRHVAAVRGAAGRLFAVRPPRLVVVQGDTSSALGGALAARDAGLAVAHVEAGLRTGDPAMPWPEEDYRVAIDRFADLLFAPTAVAAANLRAECVGGLIEVTGNTAVDALVELLAVLPDPIRRSGTPSILVTCHRRENWGDGFRRIAAAVRHIAGRGFAAFDVLLHPNPHHSQAIEQELGDCLGVRLLPPCSHGELIQRMRGADLVLSDSGGMQEEAPTLGVPMLVLREKTERPEGIASGNALLVGTDTGRIVAAVEHLLVDDAARAAMSRPANPYGDGKAAPRIASAIARWIEESAPDLQRSA